MQRLVARHDARIGLVQAVVQAVEQSDLFGRRPLATVTQFGAQRGACQQTAPDHHPGHRGLRGHEGFHVGGGEQVAVVEERMRAHGGKARKGGAVGRAFVARHPQTRVERDAHQGGGGHEGREAVELRGVVPAQTEFHREAHFGIGAHALEDFGRALRQRQESAAASVACLQGEGATHVEVDAPVAQRGDDVDQARQFVGIGRDDLRHQGHPLVVFGVDVAEVFGAHTAVLPPHEGRVVGRDAAHQSVVQSPIDVVGVTLKRSEVQRFHECKVTAFF